MKSGLKEEAFKWRRGKKKKVGGVSKKNARRERSSRGGSG